MRLDMMQIDNISKYRTHSEGRRRHWLSQEGLCQHGIGAEEIKNKRKRFLHKPRQGPQFEQLPLHKLVAASWSRYPEQPVVADS
jgi:hypothetical protein